MKEVALYDAKNSLSALIQEVEETGEEILITRHGKPAAKLTPAAVPSAEQRTAALARLAALQEEAERRFPDAPRLTWEELKVWARDEDKDLYKNL